MTKIDIVDESPLYVETLKVNKDESFIILKDDQSVSGLWLDVDEVRKLVKALKKHIKKAEGK